MKKKNKNPSDPQFPQLRNNNHLYNFAAGLFLNGVSELDCDRFAVWVFG